MQTLIPVAELERVPGVGPLLAIARRRPGLYLVGGAVRELLRGRLPRDLDVAVEGELAPLLAELGTEVDTATEPGIVHERFGTATVHLEGVTIDLARSRAERYARPGALPEVRPAPIETDLLRRDFTVNALAAALGGPSAGRVLSAPGALEDLDHGVLRVLHAASFQDDPTRLLRLVRYAARLGFAIEPETRRLAAGAIAGGALWTAGGSRIGAELRLLAGEPSAPESLRRARELGLDAAVHADFGLRDPARLEVALALLPADGVPEALILAAAALDLPEGALRPLLDRLDFPAALRDRIVATASAARELAGRLAGANRPSDIAAATRGWPLEAVALAGALGPRRAAEEWLDRLRFVRTATTGTDLLRAGVPEGPAVGAGLAAALAAKLDGLAEGPEQELAVALRAAAQSDFPSI